MNYLLEDIFRRADTWQGIGQKDRVFLDPSAPSANAGAHSEQAIATGFDTLDAQLYNSGWPLGGCIEVISDQCGLDAMGVFMPTMKKLSANRAGKSLLIPPTRLMPHCLQEKALICKKLCWCTLAIVRSYCGQLNRRCAAAPVVLSLLGLAPRTIVMQSCGKSSWPQPVTAH